jgi:hypothetical protein
MQRPNPRLCPACRRAGRRHPRAAALRPARGFIALALLLGGNVVCLAQTARFLPPVTECPLPADACVSSDSKNEGASGVAGKQKEENSICESGKLKSEATAAQEEGFSWAKIPPLQVPLPRAGYFILSPTGPGYYSLRDVLTDHWRETPPKYPYPPYSSNAYPFFDADFRYLDDPNNTQHDLFDPIKRMHLGDDWLLSLGGEERLRYMDEIDDARLTNVRNPHLLERTRLYGDLWYLDQFRVYVEGIDAQTTPQRLPPLPIDVDHMDIWNLFVDWKAYQFDGKPLYLRAGRQELYFGSQRLVSPSDWSNIPRTFQGIRAMYQGDKWSVDAFWVHPVHINPTNLDSPDRSQNFAGLWSTYRPRKGQSVDIYYLFLNQSQAVALGQGGVPGGFNVNTWGSRYAGDNNNVLWDVEGMLQLGNWSNQALLAGALTTGLGYRFAELPYNPNFWAYFDYASGDPHPGEGNTRHTFNQLFPWGHTYFGYLDLVGRQNILDPNMQLTVNPTKWIVVGLQGHFFYLASARDALYNASGQAIHIDPTGRSGTHVGNELDFYTNFHLSMHQDVLVGYSHLFLGDYLQKAGIRPAPDLFYLQYSFKF